MCNLKHDAIFYDIQSQMFERKEFDAGFYIQKWIIENTKLTAKNYHRYSKLFEIRRVAKQ